MYDYEMYGDDYAMNKGSNATLYDYYYDFEESIIEAILKWFEACFVVPLGVLGNILVLCVLLKKKYDKSSTAMFISSLAVSDITILITGIYNLMTIRLPNTLDCQILTYVWLSSGQMSSCILAIVAVERAVSVTCPHKAKFIFTARNAKVIIAIATIAVFGLNAALIMGYEMGGENFFEQMYCPTTDILLSSVVHVYPAVDFCLGFAIPFVVIVVCSIIIIMKLRPAMLIQKKDKKKISAVTKTLLSTNACFLITLSPTRIYNIIYPIPLADDAGFYLFVVFSMISQMNAAANFFLYFLNAPVFRGDVIRFFCQNAMSDKKSKTTRFNQSNNTKPNQ